MFRLQIMNEQRLAQVVEKIRKYSKRCKFQQNCWDDYTWLKEQGLISILDDMLPRQNTIRDVITLDYALERARRLKTLSEFQQRFYKCYRWIVDNNLEAKLHEILPPISYEERSRRSAAIRCYSETDLIEDAKRFKTRQEWREAGIVERQHGAYSHYGSALKQGRAFMQICCKHMVHGMIGNKYRLKHSDADLLASARRFQTRGQWKVQANNTYQAAKYRPIWDECVAHMRPAVNPYAKDYVVYVYEFSDNHCYVGLSIVPENRKASHACRGPVFDHAEICSNQVYKTLEMDLSYLEVGPAEGRWQQIYEEKGWIALHTAPAGSLGSVPFRSKWTKELILAEALKYQTKQAWIDGSQGTYRTAKKEGWFEEASMHMPKYDKSRLVTRIISDEVKAKMRKAKLGKTQDATQASIRIALGNATVKLKRDAIRQQLLADPTLNTSTLDELCKRYEMSRPTMRKYLFEIKQLSENI